MYIATVIPIKKGMQKEYLSYFSAQDIPLGTIVTVPVRAKTIDAIVISMEDARTKKADLKSAKYQLKKVLGIKGRSPFTKEFFIACERMKDYVVSSTGSVIQNMLPSVFLENIKDLKELPVIETIYEPLNIKHEKLIFQALTPDRLAFYRTLIREAFAKKESVYLCVPTRYDINEWHASLVKGIEQYVFTFHSEMTKKGLIASYNQSLALPHPILIIGTGMFLSIPRRDIKTIILEHESSDTYKQWTKPYIDIRSFVEVLSSINKSKLIFGDTLLRPDTLYRRDQDELGEIASPLFRLPEVERQIVIDMKEELDEKGEKKFKVLSDKTKKMIEHAVANNESVFLFSVRKGLAGVTVCHDCGHTILCPNCSNPVVLYGAKQRTSTKIENTRVFMCNKCGHKETTEVKCKNCESWNLTPLGIGTDRVFEEVRDLFPKASVLQIDKETTPIDKEALSAINAFYKKPGSILIGTEMAFSYLHTAVTHSAIISLDGLLSIPSFNITQKILHIIEKLHYTTTRNLIIQTRIPENQILGYILSGNVLPLYREDLKERKSFGYPPFVRLIKITFAGSASETEKARNYLNSTLEIYDPQIFSAFIGKVKGQYITNTVIKVDRVGWQLPIAERKPEHSHLADVLFSLPPSFSINVDPEDLL
jgi:primosomal protein N' (replication factor Y) (superfamily II helicase)